MTGIYFRVNRNGKWVNKEIEYLTNEERQELFKDRTNEELIRVINALCQNLDYISEEDEEE